jgi:2-keto-4-pentenoate hydratase/2-oxohepta-3-ene-1,7-dioic acid hydratase in catechol pathway
MRFARLGSSSEGYFARLDGPRAHVLDRAPWHGRSETGKVHTFSEGDLRCPVAPSKIVCIGRNYAAHAREVGGDVPTEPLLFLKPPSSLAGPGDAVVLPPESKHVEHEAELAVVVGRRCSKVTRESAMDYVLGYTCACDVSARDLQKKDGQWARAKGFDTFCPMGPWIETDLDWRAAPIRCLVGGQVRQSSTTADMVFDVPTLVSFISRMMTLEPGDVILTGTPEGVSPIKPGDKLDVEIGGIGILKLHVESRPPASAAP